MFLYAHSLIFLLLGDRHLLQSCWNSSGGANTPWCNFSLFVSHYSDLIYSKSPLRHSNRLFNNCKDLLNHFSEGFGLITCKSFQWSGSLEEITDVKLSGINIPYSPFLFKLLLNMLQGTNNHFICPHVSFCEFPSSVWVIDSLISQPFIDPEGPVCLQSVFWPLALVALTLSPLTSPLEEPPPPAYSSPAGSLHCPEAAELPCLSRAANLDGGRPPSC